MAWRAAYHVRVAAERRRDTIEKVIMLLRVPLARRPLSPKTCARLVSSVYTPSSTWRSASSIARKQPCAVASARLVHNHRLARTTVTSSYTPERTQIRHATNLASRTAINPSSNVPAEHQPLYASLERLKDIASDYVNQSRLQLEDWFAWSRTRWRCGC
jgi:hypothetical protein